MKTMIKLELSSWQVAQLESLLGDTIEQFRRDGLQMHSVARDYQKLLDVLKDARNK